MRTQLFKLLCCMFITAFTEVDEKGLGSDYACVVEQHVYTAFELNRLLNRLDAVIWDANVPRISSMGSVASQMVSMRIIAAGLLRTRNIPMHFLPANSPRLPLLNEALRLESWQEELTASLSAALP
ncbi:unnamed protein product, partial [Mesorhabditis spiculigera]